MHIGQVVVYTGSDLRVMTQSDIIRTGYPRHNRYFFLVSRSISWGNVIALLDYTVIT